MTCDLGTIEPGTLTIKPIVAGRRPWVEECELRGWIVAYTDGSRVLVFVDEVRFNVTQGYKLKPKRVAEDIVERAVYRIADSRREMGNVL